MEKTCNVCGKKYNSTSELSLYCSRACKQKSYRNKVTKGVTELRNTLSVTEMKLYNAEAEALVLEAALLDFSSIDDVKRSKAIWKKIQSQRPDAEICKKAKTLREAYELIGKLND